MLLSANVASASPIYIGQWHVGDGPIWASNPAVLSAQETAALLFGGLPSDYVISTVSDDPNQINFMSYVDGWADSTFLSTPVPQNFKVDLGNPGYNDPGGFGTSYSAWVLDHSCGQRYGNPNAVCGANDSGLNYAFRVGEDIAAVPEPASLALLATGLVGLGLRLQRHRRSSPK